jgi:hypothetical protein
MSAFGHHYRSHSAVAARVELEWSLAGLWAMSLYAVVQIRRDGQSPRRLSCARLLEAFRPMLRDYLHPVCPGATLCDRLREAVIDPYPSEQNQSGLPAEEKGDSPPPARPPSSGPALEKSHWRKHYESKQQYG